MPIEPSTDPVAPVSETLASIAAELAAAERDGIPIAPISDRIPSFSLVDAYRVQRINIQRRISKGASIVGHKVGLTNQAMQAQLGVNEPDFGHLLDDMQVEAGSEISLDGFIRPRIEPEIAFIIGRELRGPEIMRADVLDATDAFAPALEIIDSRIADWKIRLVDTVADNASSSRVVIGPSQRDTSTPLIATPGYLVRDGEVIAEGRGGDVYGDPAGAVAWLVNMLAEFGESLRAGEIVIPGALSASVPLTAGSTYRADIDLVGSVSVRVAA